MMKRIFSLILALAMICGLSLAGAENEHINKFLVDLFSSIGNTDLDSQALTFTMPDYYGTCSATLQRRDGLLDGQLTIPGYSGTQRYNVQMDDQGVWFYDSANRSGYYTTFADLDEILIEVSGETDGHPNLTLDKLLSLMTKHIQAVNALGTIDNDPDHRYNSSSFVSILPLILLNGELQPTVKTENGFTTLTYEFEVSPKHTLESNFNAIDALVWDAEGLETLILYGHAVSSDLLMPVTHTTAESFDDTIRKAFGMADSEAVTPEAIMAAWEANGETIKQQALADFEKAAADPDYGYQLRQTVKVTVNLILDSKGGFDSLVLHNHETYYWREMDYDTWSYIGEPKEEVRDSTIQLAYEGRDLIVTYDSATVARITSEDDGELIIYTVSGSSETEAARLKLTRNEAYWTLNVLDPYGKSMAALKTGRPAASVQPLSAMESSMQKIDLAFLKGLIETAAPAEVYETTDAPAAVESPAAVEMPAAVAEPVEEVVEAVETVKTDAEGVY